MLGQSHGSVATGKAEKRLRVDGYQRMDGQVGGRVEDTRTQPPVTQWPKRYEQEGRENRGGSVKMKPAGNLTSGCDECLEGCS